MQRYSAPKGTKDILPSRIAAWQFVERVAREVFTCYGYTEIRTPHFEHSEVFLRGIGEDTDVVGKEMYTFPDKKNRSITLRPEGTAGVCRALIESGILNGPLPVKMFYNGSFFRYEQPQDGRQREFHQIGCEQYGAQTPMADAEMIVMLTRLFDSFGVEDTVLHLSSLGCDCCRDSFKSELTAYLENNRDSLCNDCDRRFEKNPLRVLDCKSENCGRLVEEAPSMLDYLCDDCKQHFEELKERLADAGVEFYLDRKLVRGLDYYTRTVFELKHAKAGAAKTLAGGGRYDGLSKMLGGPDVSGIGFAFGVERLMLTLEAQGNREVFSLPKPVLYLAGADNEGAAEAFRIVTELRDKGLYALCGISGKGVKPQLKEAGRLGSKFCTVIGMQEISDGKLSLRAMDSGEETQLAISELPEYLSKSRKENLDR